MGETMMIIIEGSSDHSMKSGGEEMDVMGYQTENFHVCPGALETFSKIVKQGYRGPEADMVRNLAMLTDDYLAVEVQAMKSGATPEMIENMVSIGNSVLFHLGIFANTIQDESIIQMFEFMPGHITKTMGMMSHGGMEEESC